MKFIILVEIYERIFPHIQHRDKAKCIHLRGRLHNAMSNYQHATRDYREAYEIWKKVLVAQHPDLFACLKDIVICLWRQIHYSVRVKRLIQI